MIDHIGVVVLVMLIGLRAAFGIFGTGQQGVSSRLLRCKGPTSLLQLAPLGEVHDIARFGRGHCPF